MSHHSGQSTTRPLYFETDTSRPVVIHRQDPDSWDREVRFPTVVITQRVGEDTVEVVLDWAQTLSVLRSLQGLVAKITEDRTWL